MGMINTRIDWINVVFMMVSVERHFGILLSLILTIFGVQSERDAINNPAWKTCKWVWSAEQIQCKGFVWASKNKISTKTREGYPNLGTALALRLCLSIIYVRVVHLKLCRQKAPRSPFLLSRLHHLVFSPLASLCHFSLQLAQILPTEENFLLCFRQFVSSSAEFMAVRVCLRLCVYGPIFKVAAPLLTNSVTRLALCNTLNYLFSVKKKAVSEVGRFSPKEPTSSFHRLLPSLWLMLHFCWKNKLD